MARLTRLALAGHVHLVELCALPGARLAHDDEDRAEALASLHSAAQQHRVALHAYALLDTRLYLLGTPQYNEGLSSMVQGVFSSVVWPRHPSVMRGMPCSLAPTSPLSSYTSRL